MSIDPHTLVTKDLLDTSLPWLTAVRDGLPPTAKRILDASLADGRLRITICPGPEPAVVAFVESANPSYPPLELLRATLEPVSPNTWSESHGQH